MLPRLGQRSPPCPQRFLQSIRTAAGLTVAGFLLLARGRGMAVEKPAAADEYSLKAVFLMNFTKFIEWPAGSFSNASAPFVVGLLGEDPFGAKLEGAFAGQTIAGHAIVLQRCRSGAVGEDCHLLFISRSLRQQQPALLAGLQGKPLLTVGEGDQFLEDGGIINFVIVNERVRFEVNARSAERAGLKISSKLLGVATRVVSLEPKK